MSVRLRIAIQKSGRLNEESTSLLKECGISFETSRGNDRLIADARNFPAQLLFLRDDDIPGYVADGVVDIGIVGENVVAEKGASLRTVEALGFSRCRLSLAVPKSQTYENLSDLAGKRIATSYPRLLEAFLAERSVSAQIHEISGSVEIAPGIGLSDAICDLVSSGSTLWTNGLREVETILHSQAVLVASDSLTAEKEEIVEKLLFRVRAVLRARQSKYVLLNAPLAAVERITAILPGMKSPTVVPLAMEGWCSIHSVLNEDEFWENIEELRAAGAEGILVVPIEKMIL